MQTAGYPVSTQHEITAALTVVTQSVDTGHSDVTTRHQPPPHHHSVIIMAALKPEYLQYSTVLHIFDSNENLKSKIRIQERLHL